MKLARGVVGGLEQDPRMADSTMVKILELPQLNFKIVELRTQHGYTRERHLASFELYVLRVTLALQLPALCNLQVNNSTCSGMLVPPASPDSQVSSGSNTNSSRCCFSSDFRGTEIQHYGIWIWPEHWCKVDYER
ncbi:hypothetical protein L1049_027876 [Liquidambar formosana]|uniref:Uncharacterized protein n=1 Tax=Liquidambar formosana TaxID=63359 RepID=A0AAP0RLN2_LIQFO